IFLKWNPTHPPSRRRIEAKNVTQFGQFEAELLHKFFRIFMPGEIAGQVVGQFFSWEFRMNGLRKLAGFFQVGLFSFKPNHIGIRRISEAPGYRSFETSSDNEISFIGAEKSRRS